MLVYQRVNPQLRLRTQHHLLRDVPWGINNLQEPKGQRAMDFLSGCSIHGFLITYIHNKDPKCKSS